MRTGFPRDRIKFADKILPKTRSFVKREKSFSAMAELCQA